MTDAIQELVVTCFSMVMSDEPWQDLGFSKRPRYGAFFQRFRSGWKVQLEKKALQEMLATFTAAHVLAGVVASDDIPKIVATYTVRPDVVRSLGYSSKEEGVGHLNTSIAKYLAAPPDEWSVLLTNRLDPRSVPDKKASARLFVGCAQFGTNMRRMISVIKHGT
jgi:hypothetical protein